MLPPSQKREAQVSWEEKLRSEEGFLIGVFGFFQVSQTYSLNTRSLGPAWWWCKEMKLESLIIQTVLNSLLPGDLTSGRIKGNNGGDGRGKEEISAGCT